MVFLLGALCYTTICTMKAPPHHMAFTINFHGIYRSLLSRPFQGLERRLHGVPIGCSGPGRAWEGAFMAFKLAKVLGNSHATHGSGLALINCIVADHSRL